MHKIFAPALTVLALATSAVALDAPASAKGCLRGAAAGGVAGHYAHHHAVAGAAIGCVAAHHPSAKKAKAAAQADPAPR